MNQAQRIRLSSVSSFITSKPVAANPSFCCTERVARARVGCRRFGRLRLNSESSPWIRSVSGSPTYHSGVFAGFLARFMKAIGVPKASLVGQSMGAQVALSLAVQNPQSVDRLVLVNGGSFRSGSATSNAAPPDWHARQIANAGTLSESREYLEKLYYDHSLITDELVERNLILRLRSAHTIESMQLASDRGLGGLTEEQVRGIKAPTLLVWGANDKLSPPANADKLNAVIQDSRKVLIDKAGHYPFLEHPDKFNQVVLQFLKSQS